MRPDVRKEYLQLAHCVRSEAVTEKDKKLAGCRRLRSRKRQTIQPTEKSGSFTRSRQVRSVIWEWEIEKTKCLNVIQVYQPCWVVIMETGSRNPVFKKLQNPLSTYIYSIPILGILPTKYITSIDGTVLAVLQYTGTLPLQICLPPVSAACYLHVRLSHLTPPVTPHHHRRAGSPHVTSHPPPPITTAEPGSWQTAERGGMLQ